MQLTAVLTPAEEGGFVALNPETGTATQGETIEEAIPQAAKGHPLVTVFSVPEPKVSEPLHA